MMNKISTFVYRNSLGDSTANGLTANNDRLDLYYNVTDYTDLPDDALVLIERNIGGRKANYAVPANIAKSKTHSMFGGNFVYTSDSQFPEDGPISVHDRVETTSY